MIGTPIGYPRANPTRYPNRPRIARLVTSRYVSYAPLHSAYLTGRRPDLWITGARGRRSHLAAGCSGLPAGDIR